MMNFIIKRYYTPQGTFGDLSLEGQFICHTVERPHAAFGGEHPCIPEGTFTAKMYDSPNPNHGRVWLLQEVPGRTYIEFHVANWPSQLLGCIAPGQRWGCDPGTNQWGVLDSLIAFQAFMQMTAGQDEISFTFERGV